jgi:precorrin-2/cobalt-factor-2 C20-methyltransferase
VTLYGVGLGPGDPDLVTVRGKRVLERVDRIYAPGDLAARRAGAYAPAERIEQLSFPMTRDEEALEAAWAAAAETVAPVAAHGEAAFVTIGDPKVYSTFAHLERALESDHDVEVQAVPGVSVVTAFATAMDVEIDGPVIALREARAGIPEDGPAQCLLLKVTEPEAVHEDLVAAGYDVTYGRRLFMDDSTVTSDPAELADSDYFTVAYGTREVGSA